MRVLKFPNWLLCSIALSLTVLARAPPLLDDSGDACIDDGAQIEPDRDLAAQAALDHEVDQRSW